MTFDPVAPFKEFVRNAKSKDWIRKMDKNITYESVYHGTIIHNVLLRKISNAEKLKEKYNDLSDTIYLDSPIDSILPWLKVNCQYPDTSSSISYSSNIYNSKNFRKNR